MDERISLFVPGRLCMFGEHSDWAGLHRIMNADIAKGMAIVTGIEEGIYATARKAASFIVRDEISPDASQWNRMECAMHPERLKEVAQAGGFYSYVAGVASYISEWYHVGGVEIVITERTLPIKSGLSSSAAICVLVARAFNLLYGLNLNTLGEMNIAFLGEKRTPSRCGRLDQACAFGVHPVLMTFDGNEISVDRLVIKKKLHWVISDLAASKDTIAILADLNRCYPFARSEADRQVHEALGADNAAIVQRAVEYMRQGELEQLGALMTEAQALFDEKVAPASPEQLRSPALHAILADPTVRSLSFGGKGVGSQGDGSVQFLARDKATQTQLIAYLRGLGLQAHSLTIPAKHVIRKAIVPVAGFGTRMYPATRALHKEFLPMVDTDGLVKPSILILLEQLVDSGIEEIALVVGSQEETDFYHRFFEEDLPPEHWEKLPLAARQYEGKIRSIAPKLRFVVQEERRGFGHAVYQCRAFAADEPVLLLLGDTLYRSNTRRTCSLQLIDAFDAINAPMVSIHPIPLAEVVRYGVMTGVWEGTDQTLMRITEFAEKPTVEYAQDFLATRRQDGDAAYYSVFGQYVLTPEVFQQLEEDIAANTLQGGEIQLTHALDEVRKKHALYGFAIDGRMFDIGNAQAYRAALQEYGE